VSGGSLALSGPTVEGLDVARCFSQQVSASLGEVLSRCYVYPGSCHLDGSACHYPAGTVHTAPHGTGHWKTMWTRDVGTFLRELVLWGYFDHARLTASTLIDLVALNGEGYHTYPEQLGPEPSSGEELDGTGPIVIAMISLWRRLPVEDPVRKKIGTFLHDRSSPLLYMVRALQKAPMIPGTGEFGPGCWIEGRYCNVVQNNLCRLVLLAGADYEDEAGDGRRAESYREAARRLSENMLRYLVDPADGTWIWCVRPSDLKPDPEVLAAEVNRGAGLTNGVGCMQSEVTGLDPAAAGWPGDIVSQATFEKLYRTEPRKSYFDEVGVWTQFDPPFREGRNTSPSYGQGYALQYMLLADRQDMAGKALDWLARVTAQGEHPEWFVEQMNYPFDKGTYFLNLVNVSEPLKVARLILGVDDTRPDELHLVPRLFGAITTVEATDWPIRTSCGTVRANIRYEQVGEGYAVSVTVRDGGRLPALKARLSQGEGYVWKTATDVQDLTLR
jgi:hypothetical protein